jgi:hypothetical protein
MTAPVPLTAQVVNSRFVPLVVAGLVATIILFVATTQPAGVFWDDGVYLITARALANGDGYRFMHLPGSPAAVHFPPGWPLLLAAVWKVIPSFPENLVAYRLLNPMIAATAAGLSCAYAIRRLELDARVAALAAIVFAAALPLLILDTVLFSEPAFLALLVASLFAADRAVVSGTMRDALVVGAVAGVTTLTRSTGLVLVPAIAGALLLARRPRQAGVALAAALALILPWQLWSSVGAGELAEPLRGNYGPYLPWLADAVRERGPRFLAAVAWQNIVSMQQSLAVVFFPIGLRWVRPLLVALVIVVGVTGVVQAWKRATTLCLFLACYAVLVVVWPYSPDRFAWAVWPLVGSVLALGAMTAYGLLRHTGSPRAVRFSAGVLVGVTILATLGASFYSARGISRGWADVAQRRNAARLLPVAEWVARNTPADAVIACDGEPLVHLYTGRRVVPVHILSPDEYLAGTPLQQAADDMRRLITAGRADFAVLSAGASELEAAELLGAGTGFPRLVPLDTLPGGGVAFRVQWQD